MRRALATAAAAAALLGLGPLVPAARADGDPASDYLLVQQVFLPFDAKFPKAQQAQLTGYVAAANRAGFKIRVAVIWSSYDLGSVTSLWKQPRTYARFLSEELSFVYKHRLLVVFPNGFGFNWLQHPTSAEYAVLSKIPVEPSPAGMVAAAQTAVEKLAAAAGVKVVATGASTSPARRNSHDRAVIALAALAVLAVGVLARFALRARKRPQ